MHISIIEDEKILANKVMKKLQNNGYAANAFYGFEDFMRHGDAHSQLYIIDISLGDGSGFDIVHWLRKSQKSEAPIMIISGYGDSQNKIYGLDIGADDYLVKPLIPEELLARIKAVLRRPQGLVAEQYIKYKNLSFDVHTKEVKVNKKLVYLTKNEILVLEFFLTHKGKVITRENLIDHVWGGCSFPKVSDNTINVTLSNIRKKLGLNFVLKTIYNHGYALE